MHWFGVKTLINRKKREKILANYNLRDLKNIENIASYKVNDFLQFPQFIMLFQPIEKNVSLVKICLSSVIN